MNKTTPNVATRSPILLVLVLTFAGASLAKCAAHHAVTIRGPQQGIYFDPATDSQLSRKVLFVPGDGGWRGWALTVTQQTTRLTSAGRKVVCKLTTPPNLFC